jgi:glycosyltransferase involved in cell wall biosynthesis
LVAAGGGVLEFARHGGNAWLVAPDSATAIAEGLARLLADAGLRRCLAQGALRTARERAWDAVYDQLLDDYRAAASEKGRLIRAA